MPVDVGVGRRSLLEGRCVHDHVDAAEGALQPLGVAHVTEEEPKPAFAVEGLAHLVLFECVARVDDHLASRRGSRDGA